MGKISEKLNLAQCKPEAKVFDKFYKTKRGEFLNQEISRSMAVNWDKKNTETCHILMVGYAAFPVHSRRIFNPGASKND